MITKLVLHPRTRQSVQDFLAAPGHSLLLIGAEGSGKPTLARAILTELLTINEDQLTSYPYFLCIKPEKTSISIEAIRNLQDFLRLRTVGKNSIRRAVLVEDAHLLTTEAQNAFLKLLEEPPADTVIILAAQTGDGLLPTIHSRAPTIIIKTPIQAETTNHFVKANHDEAEVTKNYYLSHGQIGLMQRLLQNNPDDELLAYVEAAKDFLRQKPFERLVYVDQFTKQKKDVAVFLWALQRVASAALQQAAAKNSLKLVRHWQKVVTATLEAQDDLSANPQLKLLLTNLSLQL